jgi:phage terminase large subunit GpA-like protein
MVSTPTIKGLSRIEREFEGTDQRRYFVPCPHCNHMQWLRFERLIWEKGRPETAEYVCENCERGIAEHHKTAMLARGEWRVTATGADPFVVGFHISGLYSPVGWLSWAQIAREWEAAQGNDAALKTAKNTLRRNLAGARRSPGLEAALRARKGAPASRRSVGRACADRRRRRAA